MSINCYVPHHGCKVGMQATYASLKVWMSIPRTRTARSKEQQYRTTAQHVLANQPWTSKWAIHSARWGPSLFLFLLSLRLSLSISISFDLTQLAVAWCIRMCQHSKSAVGLRQAAVLLGFPPCPSPPIWDMAKQCRAFQITHWWREQMCSEQHTPTCCNYLHEPSWTIINHHEPALWINISFEPHTCTARLGENMRVILPPEHGAHCSKTAPWSKLDIARPNEIGFPDSCSKFSHLLFAYKIL